VSEGAGQVLGKKSSDIYICSWVLSRRKVDDYGGIVSVFVHSH